MPRGIGHVGADAFVQRPVGGQAILVADEAGAESAADFRFRKRPAPHAHLVQLAREPKAIVPAADEQAVGVGARGGAKIISFEIAAGVRPPVDVENDSDGLVERRRHVRPLARRHRAFRRVE